MNKLRFSTNGHSNGKVKYDTREKSRRKTVRAGNDSQRAYMDAINRCDVVFCVGPAGTGKTHIAAGMAAKYLLSEEVSSIQLARPAVEVGDKLGFLPGDLDDKIHPYLRPLLKELQDFIGPDELRKLRQGECPVVEFAVLQYLRGCNFKDSFVILDEAQNATFAQMKMFLTRLDHGSKVIVNGDPSQSDLPPDQQGALMYYSNLYSDFDEVAVVRMSPQDNMRHPLVEKMIAREYEDRSH